MNFKIPQRYGHFVYGVIQSGVTCAIAAAIACMPLIREGAFLQHWFRSWTLSWATMLPVVVVAAPLIRRLAERIASGS
jgi:hypothetical protein